MLGAEFFMIPNYQYILLKIMKIFLFIHWLAADYSISYFNASVSKTILILI